MFSPCELKYEEFWNFTTTCVELWTFSSLKSIHTLTWTISAHLLHKTFVFANWRICAVILKRNRKKISFLENGQIAIMAISKIVWLDFYCLILYVGNYCLKLSNFFFQRMQQMIMYYFKSYTRILLVLFSPRTKCMHST